MSLKKTLVIANTFALSTGAIGLGYNAHVLYALGMTPMRLVWLGASVLLTTICLSNARDLRRMP
jgi:hypothetical protein